MSALMSRERLHVSLISGEKNSKSESKLMWCLSFGRDPHNFWVRESRQEEYYRVWPNIQSFWVRRSKQLAIIMSVFGVIALASLVCVADCTYNTGAETRKIVSANHETAIRSANEFVIIQNYSMMSAFLVLYIGYFQIFVQQRKLLDLSSKNVIFLKYQFAILKRWPWRTESFYKKWISRHYFVPKLGTIW